MDRDQYRVLISPLEPIVTSQAERRCSEKPYEITLGGLATRAAWQADVAARSNIQEGEGPIIRTTLRNYQQTHSSENFMKVLLAAHQDGLIDNPVTMSVREIDRLVDERSELQVQNRAEVADGWPVIEEVVTAGVEAGIRQGYFPEVVRDRLPGALRLTRVVVADPILLNEHAYCDHWNDEIVLGDVSEYTIVHELLHKMSGGKFVRHTRKATKTGRPEKLIGRVRTGLGQPYTKLDEALVEHFAAAFIEGDFGTLDPDARQVKSIDSSESSESYKRRKVLTKLTRESHGLVSLQVSSRAQFEDTEPKADLSARRGFVTQVISAYRLGTFSWADSLLTAAKLEEILPYIHGPKVDSRGNVIERGWIDGQPEYERVGAVKCGLD